MTTPSSSASEDKTNTGILVQSKSLSGTQIARIAKSLVDRGIAPDALNDKYWQDTYWSALHAYGNIVGIIQPTTVTELYSEMCKRAAARVNDFIARREHSRLAPLGT